jgi:hypothetical protein
MLIKLKVDGGPGHLFVETEEIAAIMPGQREMDGGAVILLRASENGVNVLETPDEVYDAIMATRENERAYRVPRADPA